MRHKSLLLLVLAAVCSIVAVGIAHGQLIKPKNEVEVELTPGVDWELMSSYHWSPHQGPGRAENRANHIRITRAIQKEFEARGIEPDTTRPKLHVMYEVERGKELKGTPTYGRTVDPTNQRTNIAFDQVEVGSLKITIFDAETNTTLWKATLREELLTPDKSEKQINSAVSRMFGKFPVDKKDAESK